MDDAELRRWAAHLRGVAGPVVARDEVGRDFVDDLGHRRPVDGAFLSWCGRAPERARGDGGGRGGGGARAGLDVMLWESVCMARGDGGTARRLLRDLALGGSGALTDQQEFAAIEVWTETELSALHALWWLAHLCADEAVRGRVWSAARWHVEHLQPDNATNHPWGLHVFLLLERESAGIGGRLHAETLLHNCQMGLGRVDLFSAYVLLDCARGIEEEVDRGTGMGNRERD